MRLCLCIVFGPPRRCFQWKRAISLEPRLQHESAVEETAMKIEYEPVVTESGIGTSERPNLNSTSVDGTVSTL